MRINLTNNEMICILNSLYVFSHIQNNDIDIGIPLTPDSPEELIALYNKLLYTFNRSNI